MIARILNSSRPKSGIMSDQMARNTIHNVTDINLMKIGCEDAGAMITMTAEDIRVEEEGAFSPLLADVVFLLPR